MEKLINGMTSAYILKINREQPKKEQRKTVTILLIQQSNQIKNTVWGLFA